MIETPIYGIIKILWKRPNNKLIISRIIDHDLKDSSQGNKRCRSRKGIYNKKTSSQDLGFFKRTDYGMNRVRIDWGYEIVCDTM
jgi:hypothetical protein